MNHRYCYMNHTTVGIFHSCPWIFRSTWILGHLQLTSLPLVRSCDLRTNGADASYSSLQSREHAKHSFKFIDARFRGREDILSA
jgi:hypothetical protein